MLLLARSPRADHLALIVASPATVTATFTVVLLVPTPSIRSGSRGDLMRRLTIFVLVAFAALVPGRAPAEPGQWCNTIPLADDTYAGTDSRVRVEVIDGTRTVVLVPPRYHSSNARYPVLWLFHGGLSHEDCFLSKTDLITFTAAQPADRQAIIVVPDGGPGSAWIDSRDGQLRDETRFFDEFIPAIDARYRTRSGGSYRAIAGFSAGGFGAMHLVARHPDRFAAVAGLSGIVEMKETDWFTGPAYGLGQFVYPVLFGGSPSPDGSIGNPVSEVVRWRDIDPVALAHNFGGVSVHIYTGSGIPCDQRDVLELRTLFPFSALERHVQDWGDHLSFGLRQAGVAHTLVARPCGIHTYRWVQQDLHEWWSRLFDAFGKAGPSSFDHRRAIGSFSAWGWTFSADPARASEFLDVAGASCNGLGLTGSGLTSVTTATCFEPGEVVGLTGATTPSAKADLAGRITFDLDLGPAHQIQQYTAAARALEAAGGYWTSRTVTFN